MPRTPSPIVRSVIRSVVRSVVLAVVAGAAVVVGASSPASADTINPFTLDSRPAGLPATDDPTRRLETGSVTVAESDRDGTGVSAQVTLVAEPTTEDDAVLVIGVGVPDDDGRCVLSWQRSVSTFAPATADPDPADVPRSLEREGARLDLRWGLTGEASGLVFSARCVTARILDPLSGSTLDGLDGASQGGPFLIDPIYRATITDVRGRHVRPNRWVRLTVAVTSQSDVRGFRLEGVGRGIDRTQRDVTRSVPEGTTTEVTLRVRVKVDRPRVIVLHLITSLSTLEAIDVKRVRLVPRRAPAGSR